MPEPVDGLPAVPSTRMSNILRWIFIRQIRKNIHQLRIAKESFASQEVPPEQPIVAFGNHPSWWDPLIAISSEVYFFPERQSYAPIDAAMLEKYGIFKKVGFFGVDREGSSKDAVKFLRTTSGLLDRPNTLLWMTPQGHFTDPRARPVTFERGIAHLAHRCPHALFIPLALECVFWEESQPEVLLLLGPPVQYDAQSEVNDILSQLETALERGQDRLAELSIARQTDAFHSALDGSSGVGGIYDTWRSLRQVLKGKRPSLNHSDL